jgi:hypothetical protein
MDPCAPAALCRLDRHRGSALRRRAAVGARRAGRQSRRRVRRHADAPAPCLAHHRRDAGRRVRNGRRATRHACGALLRRPPRPRVAGARSQTARPRRGSRRLVRGGAPGPRRELEHQHRGDDHRRRGHDRRHAHLRQRSEHSVDRPHRLRAAPPGATRTLLCPAGRGPARRPTPSWPRAARRAR